ncbi:hypothetical protein Mapa_007733 [Marchantia paleacea]|nr:hypothetical protein Mapa_007733 [Marchantia paleacea]
MQGEYAISWPEAVKIRRHETGHYDSFHRRHDVSCGVAVGDEHILKSGVFWSRPSVHEEDEEEVEELYGGGRRHRHRQVKVQHISAEEKVKSCGYVEEEFCCAVCGMASSDSLEMAHSRCALCKLQFSTRKAPNKHLSSDAGTQNFCPLCEVDFPCSSGSRRRRRPSDALDELVGVTAKLNDLTMSLRENECDYCPSRASSSQDLQIHLQRDHIRCYPCKQGFFSRKSLVDHMKESPRHTLCYRCETDFQFEHELKDHRQSYHEELGQGYDEEQEEEADDDICCYLCIEPFDSVLDKMWHEYDQHLNCSACFKIFASRKAFDAHLSSSKGHNFCFECNINFPFREQLAQHRRCTSHKVPFNCLPRMSDAGVKKKVYVCNKCHDYEGDDIFMKFASEQELQNHIDTMHNTCLRCDQDFNSQEALTQHNLQSERHHFCRECDYDFPSKQAFDMHCRTGLHMD